MGMTKKGVWDRLSFLSTIFSQHKSMHGDLGLRRGGDVCMCEGGNTPKVDGEMLDKDVCAQPHWAFRYLLTGVPSGPRNVISIVNETSIILEWHPPRENGGRDDVTYNIICKKCRADRRSCSRCDDNVEFVPKQLGLTECRVSISSLWAHTPYTFDIQAVNGVSSKSPFPPQHVSVNITTNQAGKSLCSSVYEAASLSTSVQKQATDTPIRPQPFYRERRCQVMGICGDGGIRCTVLPLTGSWILRHFLVPSRKAKTYFQARVGPSALQPAGAQQMPLER